MAKTNTERQRDWRHRQREQQDAVARLTDELAAWKAEAKRWGEVQRAQSAAQQDEITRLTDALEAAQDGQRVPPCKVCGGELACPPCSRGGGYADDF
jgi:hypothetical protein